MSLRASRGRNRVQEELGFLSLLCPERLWGWKDCPKKGLEESTTELRTSGPLWPQRSLLVPSCGAGGQPSRHPHFTWSHPERLQKQQAQELSLPHLSYGLGSTEPSKRRSEKESGQWWGVGGQRRSSADREVEEEDLEEGRPGESLGERVGRDDQRPESRGKLGRSGSLRRWWGGCPREQSRAVAESRQSKVAVVTGMPFCWSPGLHPCARPSLHLPHFPSSLPAPRTPGLTVSLRSGKSEGADSQQQHPPPLWWHSPCLLPQSWVSPPPPPRPCPTFQTAPSARDLLRPRTISA